MEGHWVIGGLEQKHCCPLVPVVKQAAAKGQVEEDGAQAAGGVAWSALLEQGVAVGFKIAAYVLECPRRPGVLPHTAAHLFNLIRTEKQAFFHWIHALLFRVAHSSTLLCGGACDLLIHGKFRMGLNCIWLGMSRRSTQQGAVVCHPIRGEIVATQI
jgi:hypothetical protein